MASLKVSLMVGMNELYVDLKVTTNKTFCLSYRACFLLVENGWALGVSAASLDGKFESYLNLECQRSHMSLGCSIIWKWVQGF